MVYSTLPLYHLDPQANWHLQQSNDHHHQQQLLLQTQHGNRCLSPQPTPPPNKVGGSEQTTGLVKPNSMVDQARQAQLPLPEAGLKCPRCESTNTKFCYFNNYNLSQPRHFCKTCRRYWTRGGSLRNVPVGGATRRTAKRSKARPGSSATISVSSGGSRSMGSGIGSTSSLGSVGNNNNACSTSLFLSHSLPQVPFLPSLHQYGYANPNHIGLNLLGHGGADVEFPNLLASFEGLGRINNGMHPFENSSLGNLIGHSLQSKPMDMNGEVIDQMSSTKLEDHRGVNFSKEFALVQGHNDQNHYNWNTNVWSNGNSDISAFASPSNGHLLG